MFSFYALSDNVSSYYLIVKHPAQPLKKLLLEMGMDFSPV